MFYSPKAVGLRDLMEHQPPTQLIDFEIRSYGGTTTAFDLVADRGQPKPAMKSVKERIIELNSENGRLHYEANYYAILANSILRNLFPILQSPVSRLYWAFARENDVERFPYLFQLSRYREALDSGLQPGKTQTCVVSGQSSVVSQREKLYQKGNPRPQPKFGSPRIQNGVTREHTLYGVVVSLTRENGNMRQSIELNKNLVNVVLVKLMAEVRQSICGIQTVMKEANDMIQYANDMWRQDVCSESLAGWPMQFKTSAASPTSSNNMVSITCCVQPLLLSKEQGTIHHDTSNSVSSSILIRQYDILQYQSSCYQWLIGLAQLRLLPMITHHLVELLSILRDYRATSRNARTLLQHRLRKSL